MLSDELKKWCESNHFKPAAKEKKSAPIKNKSNKKNKYSDNNYAEMMGMNRPVYRRSRGGSFRQR